MGLFGCCLSPQTAEDKGGEASAVNGKNNEDKVKTSGDFGLGETHELIKVLGKGAEGEAWLMKERSTGQLVAVKLLTRPLTEQQFNTIKLETKIQAWLGRGCVNIVPAKSGVLTKSHLGVIMEFEAGGDMVGYVSSRMPVGGGMCMEEDEARYFFLQLVNAIQYCHKHQVAHRDLKLDNILLDEHNPPWIKLCDFGFAKPISDKSSHNRLRLMSMRVGTPDYMGPEVIQSSFPNAGYDGGKADMWSMGVLLYVMLTAQFPFDIEKESKAEDQEHLTYEIWAKQNEAPWHDIKANADAVRYFSKELKDMLDKVFEIDPDKRIDVGSILSHPWLTQPLTPKYQAAMDKIVAQQKFLDESKPDLGAYDDKRIANPQSLLFAENAKKKTLDGVVPSKPLFIDLTQYNLLPA